MPSDASRYEIHYHPNSGQTFLVTAGTRREFVSVGGSTAAQQLAEQINQGAVDRRPGSPNQLVGSAAVHFLESLRVV